MGNSIQITGFLGGQRARAREGKILLTIAGSGMNEMLSVNFQGTYLVTVPLRIVEQLARDTRGKTLGGRKSHEESLRITGHGADNRSGPTEGVVSLWFSSQDGFEMLSLEFQGKGQISLAYQSVESLVRSVRRGLI